MKALVRKTRCAVYTRVSTDERLDMEFNSLDAQREAALSYIASQKHEGWMAVDDRYDDGGFSGGTMERPSLQRLLRDVENGALDIIVVYKVDRLSRSLTDFARIVQILERHGVSFVSVTQAFNTTTSMGRLTLNILETCARICLAVVQISDSCGSRRIGDSAMARRRIGQEVLVFGDPASQRSRTLDRLAELVDWAGIETVLSPIYTSAKGEEAWPSLALFKALLLSVWYDLSDERLAEALDDRVSFRRFCGFSRSEATPERTAFARFRRELVARKLDRSLFDQVMEQLRAKRVRVRQGTLIDATVIASASEDDAEAGWSGHRSRKAVHSYKAHVTADADDALVETLAVTPGNVHDGKAGAAIVPQAPGTVYADSAYRGDRFAGAVRAKGGQTAVTATGYWARKGDREAAARFLAQNVMIHRVRGRIEKVFGVWKRSYGLRRMRWRGLSKCRLQVYLTATAYNLRRALTILSAA